jgi:hypothetical protein
VKTFSRPRNAVRNCDGKGGVFSATACGLETGFANSLRSLIARSLRSCTKCNSLERLLFLPLAMLEYTGAAEKPAGGSDPHPHAR